MITSTYGPYNEARHLARMLKRPAFVVVMPDGSLRRRCPVEIPVDWGDETPVWIVYPDGKESKYVQEKVHQCP